VSIRNPGQADGCRSDLATACSGTGGKPLLLCCDFGGFSWVGRSGGSVPALLRPTRSAVVGITPV